MGKRRMMCVIAEVAPEVVLNHQGPYLKTFVIGGMEYLVSMESDRYKLFERSLQCVNCGLVGVVMRLEYHFDKHKDSHEYNQPHFNLYAIRQDGTYVLMTKDHIWPKSKGGPDSLVNYQTMCAPCNVRKAARMPHKSHPVIERLQQLDASAFAPRVAA